MNVMTSLTPPPVFGVSSRFHGKLSVFGAVNPPRTVLIVPVKYRSLA